MNDISRRRLPFTLLAFWSARILPAWFGIALIIFMMQIAVSAIVHDNASVRTFLAFLDVLPSIIKTALGGDMLESGNIAGLLTVGYQHPFVLFLIMLFAVGVPAGLLTGEVQRGAMELILSRPVTKTQVYVCACILTLVGTFGLGLVMFLGTVAAVHIYDFGEPIPLDLFWRIAVNAGLLASAFAAFALLISASLGRLYTAVGVAVAFLSLNYFVAITAQWWPPVHFLRRATLFYLVYYSDLLSGWPLRNMGILAGILVVVAVVGGFVWHRRDLPL